MHYPATRMAVARAGAAADRGWGRAWTVSCVALYLALAAAGARVFPASHDEGITWDQAVGHLPLAPGSSIPIASLYKALEGDGGHGSRAVIGALLSPDGMHPPAYYLFMNRWIRAVGAERLVVNLPALLLGVVSLFAMRRLGSRLGPDPAAGRWSMLLLALSPSFLDTTLLARPYAAVICLTLVSTDVLLSLRDPGPRGRRRVAFVALSLLGLYGLYHYAFVLAWQLALLGVLVARGPAEERRREALALAAMALAIALGFAPWLPALLHHLDTTRGVDQYYFVGAVPVGEWPARTARLLRVLVLGDGVRPLGAVFPLALAALGGVTLVLAVRSFLPDRRAAEDATVRAFWATTPLLPALVLAADVWHGTHTVFLSKTSLALPALLLLLAVRAWHTPRRRELRVAGLVATSLLLGSASIGAVVARALSTTPYEWVARHLADRDLPSHRVLLSSARPGYVYPLLLTLREAGVEAVQLGFSPPETLLDDLRALGSSPEISRVSLVNLNVSYERDRIWSAELLRAARRQARGAGWTVERPARGASPPESGDAARTLWILSPVQVDYSPP